MYTVHVHDSEQLETFDTRQQAVSAAKQISEATARPVLVTDAARNERLTFRRGVLQEGVFVTRDRRRKPGAPA